MSWTDKFIVSAVSEGVAVHGIGDTRTGYDIGPFYYWESSCTGCGFQRDDVLALNVQRV